GSGHGKGVDIDTDQGQDAFPHKKKGDHDTGRHQSGLARLYVAHLVPQGNDNGDATQDIYHGKEDHPGGGYFLKVKIHGVYFATVNLRVKNTFGQFYPLKSPDPLFGYLCQQKKTLLCSNWEIPSCRKISWKRISCAT